MASRIAVAAATLFFAVACQAPWSHSACETMQIDWVNFVQVGSTQYIAGAEAPAALRESELGPVYATVKFRLSGNVCDPHYRPKDGDAAFLEPGTPIYQVQGRPPAEQLAARLNGTVLVYRAVVKT